MIKVWEGHDKPEQITYIRLTISPSGNPLLVGCDENGVMLLNGQVVIAHITAKGCLCRYRNCDVPGIQADNEGRILLDED